jgi:hypothetical protein
MNLRSQFALIGLLVLSLPPLTACRPRAAPISQPADDLPVHPNMDLVSQAPAETARAAVNLDDWLRSTCLGRWSYYMTSESPDVAMEWYATELKRRGWTDAVEEESRLPEAARLSNWGVWYNHDNDQDRIVLLVTQPITPPVNIADEPEKKAYVVMRQCTVNTSR